MTVAHDQSIRCVSYHREVTSNDFPGNQVPVAFVEGDEAAAHIGDGVPRLGVMPKRLNNVRSCRLTSRVKRHLPVCVIRV